MKDKLSTMLQTITSRTLHVNGHMTMHMKMLKQSKIASQPSLTNVTASHHKGNISSNANVPGDIFSIFSYEKIRTSTGSRKTTIMK